MPQKLIASGVDNVEMQTKKLISAYEKLLGVRIKNKHPVRSKKYTTVRAVADIKYHSWSWNLSKESGNRMGTPLVTQVRGKYFYFSKAILFLGFIENHYRHSVHSKQTQLRS